MVALWIAPVKCQELYVSSQLYVSGVVVLLSFVYIAVDNQIFEITQIIATKARDGTNARREGSAILEQ